MHLFTLYLEAYSDDKRTSFQTLDDANTMTNHGEDCGHVIMTIAEERRIHRKDIKVQELACEETSLSTFVVNKLQWTLVRRDTNKIYTAGS